LFTADGIAREANLLNYIINARIILQRDIKILRIEILCDIRTDTDRENLFRENLFREYLFRENISRINRERWLRKLI